MIREDHISQLPCVLLRVSNSRSVAASSPPALLGRRSFKPAELAWLTLCGRTLMVQAIHCLVLATSTQLQWRYWSFACTADFSIFVGDLAPDVTDFVLQETFRQFFPSVRSAKVLPALFSTSIGHTYLGGRYYCAVVAPCLYISF